MQKYSKINSFGRCSDFNGIFLRALLHTGRKGIEEEVLITPNRKMDVHVIYYSLVSFNSAKSKFLTFQKKKKPF